MKATLFSLPASHPCAAVELALRLKGIEYRRVELLPMSQIVLGPLLYGGSTVPGVRIDGERLAGSRTIIGRLEALVPDPPLLPSMRNPLARERVLEAERWGEHALQGAARRIAAAAFVGDAHAMASYAARSSLQSTVGLIRPALPILARLIARHAGASEEAVRADLAALPAQLDHIDAWIADRIIGAEQPNAADLQIGSSIQLLASIGDLRELIADRPAERLARWFPQLAGSVPVGTLPSDWLARGPATGAPAPGSRFAAPGAS